MPLLVDAAKEPWLGPLRPGFLFSTLPPGPLTRDSMARILHRVMTVELGYERYGAFGGYIGGTVAAWLGALFPDEVAGIHMIHPPFPADFDARPLTPAEEAFLASEEKYDESDGGYSAIMITRPDTIAAALNDSPIGLAAWIVDKLRDWSDCGGDLATRFDFDTILSMVIPDWATGVDRVVNAPVLRLRPQSAQAEDHRTGGVHVEP